MKLAVNFSQALVTFIKRHTAASIDFIKVPTSPLPDSLTQFDEGERYGRLLPHIAQPGVLSLGHIHEDLSFNEDMVLQLIKRTNPVYLSTHLDARVEYFPEFAELKQNDPSYVKRALNGRFLKRIRKVKECIKIPLVLENAPYYSWGKFHRSGSEPEFIHEICETGGCLFLLDIAHARCSAWHLQMDLYEYLNKLPLKLVKEIHLAGAMQRKDEGLRDTHTMLVDEDYDLLLYLLQKTDPAVVTLEYGGQPDRISNLKGGYDPVFRNIPEELETMVLRIGSIIGG